MFKMCVTGALGAPLIHGVRDKEALTPRASGFGARRRQGDESSRLLAKRRNDTTQDTCEVVLPPQQKCGTRIWIDPACALSADAPLADYAYVIDSNTLTLLGRSLVVVHTLCKKCRAYFVTRQCSRRLRTGKLQLLDHRVDGGNDN